ncbi:MAG TPA: hypothetical protein VFX96_11645 [Pyrinomonadaceae bacterium]|nr:hypothetical protein [Pyrinomonadaceae bacterium]
MRKFVMRLTALAAMALVVGAGAYQFSQTTASAAMICSTQCYNSCRAAYVFCRDNPDGFWSNGYAGGDCSTFFTIDFCCKWECPNTMSTNSRCMMNPWLPECRQATDPVQQYCSDTYQSSCASSCNALAAACPNGGRCANAVVSSKTGYLCSCTYTVECF